MGPRLLGRSVGWPLTPRSRARSYALVLGILGTLSNSLARGVASSSGVSAGISPDHPRSELFRCSLRFASAIELCRVSASGEAQGVRNLAAKAAT
jgi:hypothetical protein